MIYNHFKTTKDRKEKLINEDKEEREASATDYS